MTLLRLGSPIKKSDQKILTLNLIAEYQLSRRIFSTFLCPFFYSFFTLFFTVASWSELDDRLFNFDSWSLPIRECLLILDFTSRVSRKQNPHHNSTLSFRIEENQQETLPLEVLLERRSCSTMTVVLVLNFKCEALIPSLLLEKNHSTWVSLFS